MFWMKNQQPKKLVQTEVNYLVVKEDADANSMLMSYVSTTDL